MARQPKKSLSQDHPTTANNTPSTYEATPGGNPHRQPLYSARTVRPSKGAFLRIETRSHSENKSRTSAVEWVDGRTPINLLHRTLFENRPVEPPPHKGASQEKQNSSTTADHILFPKISGPIP